MIFFRGNKSAPAAAALTVVFYALLAFFFGTANFAPAPMEQIGGKNKPAVTIKLAAASALQLQTEEKSAPIKPHNESAVNKSAKDTVKGQNAENRAAYKEKTVNVKNSEQIGADDSVQNGRGKISTADGENLLNKNQNAFLNELDRKIRQNLIYPERARKNGIEGGVQILIRVSDAGLLENCMLTKSSGSPALDGAAISLLKSVFPLTAAPVKTFESKISIVYSLK